MSPDQLLQPEQPFGVIAGNCPLASGPSGSELVEAIQRGGGRFELPMGDGSIRILDVGKEGGTIGPLFPLVDCRAARFPTNTGGLVDFRR